MILRLSKKNWGLINSMLLYVNLRKGGNSADAQRTISDIDRADVLHSPRFDGRMLWRGYHG